MEQWSIKLRMRGDKGEIEIEQKTHNGNADTRKDVDQKAIELYNALGDQK